MQDRKILSNFSEQFTPLFFCLNRNSRGNGGTHRWQPVLQHPIRKRLSRIADELQDGRHDTHSGVAEYNGADEINERICRSEVVQQN